MGQSGRMSAQEGGPDEGLWVLKGLLPNKVSKTSEQKTKNSFREFIPLLVFKHESLHQNETTVFTKFPLSFLNE